MKNFLLPYFLLVLFIFSFATIIAQPANNNYASATDVSSIINSCSGNGAYTTVAATNDNGPGSCWNTAGGSNVWFKFVATTTQINVQVKTGGAEGSIQYPYVALWQSNGTTQIGCTNYTSQYSDLEVGSASLTIGNTYYFSVDNHNGSAGYRGTFKLCLQDVATNDFYEAATDVSSIINSCSSNGAYSTEMATTDKNPGSCWNTSGGSNRWFKFVATSSQINLQLFTGGAEGSLQYPYLALWQSDGTTQVGCVNYTSQYSDLNLSSTSLIPGNTYYISVDNHNGSTGYRGTFKLCLQDIATYDFYEAATNISSIINSCSSNAAYTTEMATNDKNPGSCWNTAGGSNRWFKFVATTTQINLQLFTGGTEGTIQYPYMALWQSDGTTQVACVNYTSQYSDLDLSATSLVIGNTYYVSVDNHNGSTGYRGTFKLCAQDAATYDYYEGAKNISSLINSCSLDAQYTTDMATNDKNLGSCWNTSGGSNRWFKFVATTNQINLQLFTGGSEGTLQYPYMALWQSDGTTQVACVSYTSQYSDLEVSSTGLTIGNTYYVSVDNHNGSTGYRGTFKLCMQDAVTYDFYEGAVLLNDLNNFCSADALYSTSQATSDKNPGSCWNTTGGSNRWFKFVATTTQIKVQVKTGGSEGTLQYPYLALWQNDGTSQITCVNYSSQYSDIDLSYNNLTIGDTYYVSVDNHNGSTGYRGSFAICINDKADYDFYEAAEELTDLNNWCSTNAQYTTVLATKDKNKGSCWNTAGGSNRWFKFTANSANATIQLKTGGAEGNLQYPYLALWQNDGTTQIACTNYTSQYSDISIVTAALTAGNTYYISVDNHNGSTGYRGTFSLCIDNIDQIFYSIATGTWTTVGNWSNISHSGAASVATPNIGDVVHIKGHDITLNSNINCAEINVTPDNASTSLTVDNASLTVTGVVRLTNSNKNFDGFLTAQNNSTVNISNDFLITRAGGANTFSTTIGSGCVLNVGRDLTISSTSGSAVDNNFTVNGSGKVNVTRDFTLSNVSGQKTVIAFNNTAALTVTRDLVFSASASNKIELLFNNTSSLNLHRHLTKSGGYGILTFDASANFNIISSVNQQNIAGTTGTSGDLFSYSNITVNNNKITAPQIVLTGPVSLSGTFTHTKGVIKTTTANSLLLNLSNVPSIGSTTAYIDGPLQVIVANTGASTVNFPIGKGVNYRPVVLYPSHTDAASVTYTAELIASSAKALNYTLPATLDRVSDIRYWQIDRSAVANFSNATVRLYYGPNEGVTDFANLAVAKTIGAGASWVDLSGTATANGSGNILSGSFNSFSKFVLANKLAGTNPLPIELLYFTAIPINNTVNLDWATASESNNAKYEIERSLDGVNFEFLKSIYAFGDGNSLTKQSYNTIDEKPFKGISYYRLKQIDKSGEFKYAAIVSVEFKNETAINLFPNPAINKLNIKASESYTNATIKIINTIGVEVKQNAKLSSYNGTIDISDLVSGIYFVIIENGDKIENIKISIQK